MNHHFINSILQWLLIAIVLTAIGALVLGVVAEGGKGPTVIGLLIGGALIWAEHYTKKRAKKRDVLEMETSADKAEDGTDALPASEEAPTESYRIEREDNFSTYQLVYDDATIHLEYHQPPLSGKEKTFPLIYNRYKP